MSALFFLDVVVSLLVVFSVKSLCHIFVCWCIWLRRRQDPSLQPDAGREECDALSCHDYQHRAFFCGIWGKQCGAIASRVEFTSPSRSRRACPQGIDGLANAMARGVVRAKKTPLNDTRKWGTMRFHQLLVEPQCGHFLGNLWSRFRDHAFWWP